MGQVEHDTDSSEDRERRKREKEARSAVLFLRALFDGGKAMGLDRIRRRRIDFTSLEER